MVGEQVSVLKLKGVSKRFGRNCVLKEVDLSIQRNEVIGLVGPNGAGKTTLLRIATGFFSPDSGVVEVGINNDSPASEITIGYLPERVPLYEAFTVERYLRLIATLKAIPPALILNKTERMISAFGLGSVKRTVIGSLSKGYRQRVGLAQAFLGDSDLLILDEPMNGLDPFQMVDIRDMILHAAKNRAILFSSHVVQEIEMMCNRAVFLNDGNLVDVGMADELVPPVEAFVTTSTIHVLRNSIESLAPGSIVEEMHVGGSHYRFILNLQKEEQPKIARVLAFDGELSSFRELTIGLEERLRAIKSEETQ